VAGGQDETAEPRYGVEFFARVDASAESSARGILPLVFDLVRPRSVVDVGCGSGVWLAEAARLGVEDYLGIDGYTPPASLHIPAERFLLQDLTAPVTLDRQFDLVLCLEVAEHLPPAAADVLVDTLASFGSAVLFSAAAPNQGGDHHMNEQWPDYWAERFARRGLEPVDAVRPAIWDDDEIAWWYRQNTLLFCTPPVIAQSDALREALLATRRHQLSVVHPVLHLWMTHQRDVLARELKRERGVRELAGMLRAAGGTAIRRRLPGRGSHHAAD
jgi:SAM-dependent methyltransferase